MNFGLLAPLFAVIMAVQPPASLPGIPEQIGRNAYYYQEVSTGWPPATLIFGPWENIGLADSAGKSRPISFRVGVVCPGRSTRCQPIEAFVEARLKTFGPEYQHHPLDLVLVSGQREFLPFSGTYSTSRLNSYTKDLPKNWIPGSTDSPQLPIVDFTSGGEFRLQDMEGFLGSESPILIIGEWTAVVNPSVRKDLHDLLVSANPPLKPTKGKRRGRQ